MQPNMTFFNLLEAVSANATLPEDQPEAIPPQVYTSQAFFELEKDATFNRKWICVGRSDEFAKPGTYRVTTISRDEVIVLRDFDGMLRAVCNICRHRMMSLWQERAPLRSKSPVLISHGPTNWIASLSERPICVTILTKVTVVYRNSP
mgnify:CR=1 FL=1